MLSLATILGERVQYDVPMSEHTTLGIGGPSRAMVRATTPEELVELLRVAIAGDIPYIVIGGGSNLLVADRGVDRLVIKNDATGITAAGDTAVVRSGTRLQDLVDYSLAHGWQGLQRLTGIPGTVGGAVYGNAGAYGQVISDWLEEVVCFDGRQVVSLGKGESRFAYRHSTFKENGFIILELRFRLQAADPAALTGESQGILAQRLVKYPVGLRCPGSFFKNVLASTVNPESLQLIPAERVVYGKIPAGYLLETVGARGQTLGDIHISPSNANLFINGGQGRAEHLWQLAGQFAGRVRDKYGIRLTPEVQFVNLPPLPL
ncbi:MAG: UDP-N-acetylmuramate dehydrogenase [Chloroflexi bacterium]|nr:UDP-N-acetylmuramate dehydrogenase [Chloroflexota bacterium]MCL5109441.1 UDP-N-acetylmuramate dehydrogenase [Chloroflexota bacterium]